MRLKLFNMPRPLQPNREIPSLRSLNLIGTILVILLCGEVVYCRIPGHQLIDHWRSSIVLRNYGRIPAKRSIGVRSAVLSGAADLDEQPGIDLSNEGGDSQRFPLSIRDAPPKLVEARQHGKVVLECSAYGTPAPTITWYKDGRPLFKDGKRRSSGIRFVGGAGGQVPEVEDALSETKSKINLGCLGQKDAGLYECVASNGYSKKSVATELNIVSFKDGSCKSLMGSPKPKIHQYMENYIQLIGMDALLLCRANGPHETYWMDANGLPIDIKSHKYQMTSHGDLVIRNLSFEDMGMFQCLVKNTNGQDSVETFVYPLSAAMK